MISARETPCNDNALGYDDALCNDNIMIMLHVVTMLPRKMFSIGPIIWPNTQPSLNSKMFVKKLPRRTVCRVMSSTLNQSQSDQQQPNSSICPNWYRSAPLSTHTSALRTAQVHRWTHIRNVQLSDLIRSLLKPQNQSHSKPQHP